jgi:hypothetical protein
LIQAAVTSGIIFLVGLSIIPQAYLHDAFAEHTEISICNDSHETGPCIHGDGFNCPLYELIVPHEYASGHDQLLNEPNSALFDHKSDVTSLIFEDRHSNTSGRGPPYRQINA